MEAKQISFEEQYTSRAGEAFVYAIFRHQLPPAANYWFYTIQVKHASWGYRPFGVYLTKNAFPTQELAELLARTTAVEHMKGRLEHATAQGFPVVVPSYFEGWWVF